MSASVVESSTKPVQAAPALMLGAVGVVFGDIGTSPLYTLRECLKGAGGVTQPNVFGIVSLILWSILMVVTLKYVSFVMRADNDGEGGILALTALASGVAPERLRKVLLTLGVFGAAMFYGDSMITPAISVISAVEGVTLVDAHLTAWIVPDLAGHSHRPVHYSEARHQHGRQSIRASHDRMVRDAGGARPAAHCSAPAILEAASPTFAIAFVAHAQAPRLLCWARCFWR